MEVNGVPSAILHKHKVSYLWTVEGITAHDFKPGEHVSSSRFYTDDVLKSDWKIRLYPNGHDSDSKNNLILAVIKTNSDGKGKQFSNCSFSIVGCDKQKYQELDFKNLGNNPIADLNTKHVYSLDKNNLQFQKFIHADTLSVLCEIITSKDLNEEKSVMRQELRMCSSTSIMKHSSSITSSYVNENEQTGVLLYGQSFVQIKYRKTSDDERSTDCVTFELVKHPEIDYIWCNIKFNYLVSAHSHRHSLAHSYSKKSEFEWNGKLEGVFRAEIPYCDNVSDLTVSATFSAITPNDSIVCDFITAKEEMQQNYKNLLTQPTFGDVTIHVGERALHAHKDILAARSVVFAAMFASNMLEATTKTVIVTDFQYETIHALLKHIYYGMTEVSGVDIAELFKAAVKYNLGVLQRDCEKLLSDRIDFDNVMNLMTLAGVYDTPLLKNSLLSFIKNSRHMHINE